MVQFHHHISGYSMESLDPIIHQESYLVFGPHINLPAKIKAKDEQSHHQSRRHGIPKNRPKTQVCFCTCNRWCFPAFPFKRFMPIQSTYPIAFLFRQSNPMHLICLLGHHGQSKPYIFNLELARLSQWPSKGASKSMLMFTPVSSVSQLWLSEKDAFTLSLRETEAADYFIRTLFNKL